MKKDGTTALHIDATDNEVFSMIAGETERQLRGIELIASENFTSAAVMRALGSNLTNKYSEGVPGRRYYGGNQWIDKIELLCQSRALEAYRLNPDDWHVNCQSLSGTPANFQVMTALLSPGDTIMGLDLPSGGHLSHGFQVTGKDGTLRKLTAASIYFKSCSYQTDPVTGLLDYDSIRQTALAAEPRPKLLICGGSAYPREWDYERFREIADEVGAYLLCDMAHISGLVLTEKACDPFPFCDVVTTTTHKTLRGPRGALIFCKSGLKKQIDSAVFPGCQGGPHNNVIAGIAVALKEGMTSQFTDYTEQTLFNIRHLANELRDKYGYTLVTDGTDNHLLLWNLGPQGLTGSKMELICDMCAITLNKNTVPGDKSALSPSGVRIGAPAMTTRGWKQPEMERLAALLHRLVLKAQKVQTETGKKLVDFKKYLQSDPEIQEIKEEVHTWASAYPLPVSN